MPLVVLMVFIYIFLEKIGKLETNIMLCYVIHLAVLHIFLGITKLFHHKLNGEQFLCNIFTYLFYYSIIGCFSWLLVMCSDIYWNLVFYRSILRMDSDEMTQNNIKRELEAKKRFHIYGLGAIGIPTVITFLLIILDIYFKSDDFYYCVRFQFEASKASFDYSFAPFLIIMSCGMILYAHTNTQFRDVVKIATNSSIMSTNNKHQMKLKLDHETKRFTHF